MFIPSFSLPLTLDALVRKGYLHDHAIPPLTTGPLADWVAKLPKSALNEKADYWSRPSRFSRCVRHSVPKVGHSRRILSLPNPQHQIPLCLTLVRAWPELCQHFAKSGLSLSIPVVRPNTVRALGRTRYLRDLSTERMLRSVGQRFHLYTDIVRYYGSIYTHSIGWALHGQSEARADKAEILAGNQIDTRVRATQDRQSVGIPVGPDTSLIISEIIGTAIDQRLQSLNGLKGARYVDDFHLYFRSRGECEQALSVIHSACGRYELAINDAKTRIEEMPDVAEPSWKALLRTYPLGASARSGEILSYFNLAFELAATNPQAAVLQYAVERSANIRPSDFKLYLAMLCRCIIAEPRCIERFLEVLNKSCRQPSLWASEVQSTIEEVCRHHAPLQHSYEVAWALWAAIKLRLKLSSVVGNLVSLVDDDVVALVASHAKELGLLDIDQGPLWSSWLSLDQLSGEHWLASYELGIKKWATARGGSDHIAEHPFFSLLRDANVTFYDSSQAALPPAVAPFQPGVPAEDVPFL